jgi:hypothetical protein
MVRRRSTVRFRNGAPLKDQVRSSLDSSHPTLLMGVSPYWEESGRSCLRPAASRARPVAREGEPGDAGLHGENREAYGTVALARPFDRSLARRPCRHEMITRLEHIGEPGQRKPGACIPARLTGRIIMASLYRSGEGSRLAWVAPICSNPRARPTGRAETGPAWLAVSTQHSAMMFAMYRQHSGRVSPGRTLSPEGGRPCTKSKLVI